MQFEKIWMEQCRATAAIRERFGTAAALDYLIGEKLSSFAREADRRPEFAAELPRFQAAIWTLFNRFELVAYLAERRPAARKLLRRLLFVS